MKITGRIRLSDLRPISQQEFDIACSICERIRKIKGSRTFYVQEHGLDQDIAFPASVWAEGSANPMAEPWRLVATPTYDIINRLRLYTQSFTGYQLTSFSRAYQKPILHPIPDNFDEEIARIALKPDHWVYRYIAIAQCVPTEVIARPPRILGEIGWNIDGSPVNHDAYAYQERLNLLYEAGVIDWLRKRVEDSGNVSILEIGAGYGGLAYYLKHIIPQTNYYICDIPEALLFCTLYLALACPEYGYTIYDGTDKSVLHESRFGFKFIPNFMFDDLLAANIRIDLAINTLSFSEMSERQVRYYAQNLSYMLGDTGILFEQNTDNRPTGHIYCKLYLPEYFKFRKTIKPNSVPVLIHGVADLWANKTVSDMPLPRVKKWIFTRHFGAGLRWVLLYKIGRIIAGKRFAALAEFVGSKPHLRRFVLRILGVKAYPK